MVTIDKIFPDYFERFKLPEGAHEESIRVYRACRTNRCDKESFLPSFEENGFRILDGEEDDPSQYSLSSFEKPRDIKRFAMVDSSIREPCMIAIGNTNPIHGLVQRTKERGACRNSHVDWWLYKDAEPYIEFSIIDNFKVYLEDLKRKDENRG